MKQTRLVPLTVLGVVFLSSPLFAAEKAQPVQTTVKVLKNKIKIGDEIRLLVQVEHPRKYTISPLPEKMDVSPFEIKKVDAVVLHKGQNRIQDTFGLTLTVFEIGDLKIPSFPISYRDESGNVGAVRTAPVPVKVVSVGSKLTDKNDIRPIKGPVSTGLMRFKSWIFGILASLLGIFLLTKIIIRWLRRRKELESSKPPYVRARIELERLKNQGLLEEMKVKEYYSGLSNVLRNYMERALKLDALERTTVEVVDEMKEKKMETSVIEKIRTVLENTDLVKFAKHTPDRQMADRLEVEILEVVDMTKPIEAAKK